ncbi:hypothetical protein NDU88_012265 [Pleurodeles waltl]|uniref:Leptin receptor n=1 Tax=Pleurodeles waltl TaxID=8319 RepID=A0AAV7R2R6_PLEWA|nr:hypothetical protein NDU88_012265 [Pleurodeles waltl]
MGRLRQRTESWSAESNTEVLRLVCAAGDADGFALQTSWTVYWNSSWRLEETVGASLDDINLPLATTSNDYLPLIQKVNPISLDCLYDTIRRYIGV